MGSPSRSRWSKNPRRAGTPPSRAPASWIAPLPSVRPSAVLFEVRKGCRLPVQSHVGRWPVHAHIEGGQGGRVQVVAELAFGVLSLLLEELGEQGKGRGGG